MSNHEVSANGTPAKKEKGLRRYFKNIAAAIDTAMDLFAPKMVDGKEVWVFGEQSVTRALSAVVSSILGVQTPEVSAYSQKYKVPWKRYGTPWVGKAKHTAENSATIETLGAQDYTWDLVLGTSGVLHKWLRSKHRRSQILTRKHER
jgi:hypothetical protein